MFYSFYLCYATVITVNKDLQ